MLCFLRERVRLEVFKGVSGAQRTGSEGAALAVLSTAVITYIMYAMNANVFTGAMLGELQSQAFIRQSPPARHSSPQILIGPR